MKSNDFNGMAWYYDLLSFLFFGNSIERAQCHFLSQIPDQATVLIAGDGTGKSLYHLLRHASCRKIFWIEASGSMLKRARKRIQGLEYAAEVVFIQGKAEQIVIGEKVDVIVTPFFLDLFNDQGLSKLIGHMAGQMKPGGNWICTDFVIAQNSGHRLWQNLLLKVMYCFFRLTASIESRQLPLLENFFTGNGMKKNGSCFFYKGMIETTVYRGVTEG